MEWWVLQRELLLRCLKVQTWQKLFYISLLVHVVNKKNHLFPWGGGEGSNGQLTWLKFYKKSKEFQKLFLAFVPHFLPTNFVSFKHGQSRVLFWVFCYSLGLSYSMALDGGNCNVFIVFYIELFLEITLSSVCCVITWIISARCRNVFCGMFKTTAAAAESMASLLYAAAFSWTCNFLEAAAPKPWTMYYSKVAITAQSRLAVRW